MSLSVQKYLLQVTEHEQLHYFLIMYPAIQSSWSAKHKMKAQKKKDLVSIPCSAMKYTYGFQQVIYPF